MAIFFLKSVIALSKCTNASCLAVVFVLRLVALTLICLQTCHLCANLSSHQTWLSWWNLNCNCYINKGDWFHGANLPADLSSIVVFLWFLYERFIKRTQIGERSQAGCSWDLRCGGYIWLITKHLSLLEVRTCRWNREVKQLMEMLLVQSSPAAQVQVAAEGVCQPSNVNSAQIHWIIDSQTGLGWRGP